MNFINFTLCPVPITSRYIENMSSILDIKYNLHLKTAIKIFILEVSILLSLIEFYIP